MIYLFISFFRNIVKNQESLNQEETYSYTDNKLQNRGILYFLLFYMEFLKNY